MYLVTAPPNQILKHTFIFSRNVKIWGLDFGDCHKSLFAHDDTITGLKFIANTHQIFTCGKDGQVKHWDADIFQRIVTLKG